MSDQKIVDLNNKIQNKLLEIHKENKNNKKFFFEICETYDFGHGFIINENDDVDKVIDNQLRKIYPSIILNMKDLKIAQINISSKINKKINIEISIHFIVDTIEKD